MWWPADRSWLLATEVAHVWTHVAGSDALIDRLTNDSRLEAARVRFNAPTHKATNPM